MIRPRPYTFPHKAMRNALSQLSLSAGNTNYDSIDEVQKLHRLGTEVFRIMAVHANDENEVTLKYLEEKVPGASAHDMQDHETIEAEQAELENLLNEINNKAKDGVDCRMLGEDFFYRLSYFHGDYIGHMRHEETETQALLWANFTDEELAQHRNEIISRFDPEIFLLYIKYLFPALNHAERMMIANGFITNAPKEFVDSALQVIAENLDEDNFARMMDEMGNL